MYRVIVVAEKAKNPKLNMIRKEVNILPAEDNGCTSPNPTVVTVMMVMKKASTNEYPSIKEKPRIPINNMMMKRKIE
jgi:hypothetical protein